MTADLWAAEALFQAVHVADLQQTLDIKRHPGLIEVGGIVDSAWAIGHRPSDRSVYAFMAAEGALHAGVTVLLSQWSPWAARGWEAITISVNGEVVRHNAQLGLRIHF